MKRFKVVLYNPRATFHTMPLALIALGSALDRKHYDVRIIDGRLENDPVSRVVEETKDALCLGVTALTGAPLADALLVSRAVKARRPDCPVVWGGWHASLFPADTLREGEIDATVQGQGEVTFAEILARLASRSGLDGVLGSSSAAGVGPPRAMIDPNVLPAHDYGLVSLERYFERRRGRRLDYVSSQGCRFCANPAAYRRAWFGLDPERVGEELEFLAGAHRVSDVGFQDETFFTCEQRVAAIADGFLRRRLRFTWTATMRADQGSRLDESVLARCRKAGLRRVMVGLESGSEAMLDRMKKDVTIEQVFETAEKCRRLRIAVLFNLIVGFPGEPRESIRETLAVAKRLRALGPEFQVALFFYKPYPGSEIAKGLAREVHHLPRRLEEWAAFDEGASRSPFVDREKHELIDRFKFYQQVGWSRSTPLRAPLQALARWRCRRDFYRYPIEKTMVEWLRPPAPQG